MNDIEAEALLVLERRNIDARLALLRLFTATMNATKGGRSQELHDSLTDAAKLLGIAPPPFIPRDIQR